MKLKFKQIISIPKICNRIILNLKWFDLAKHEVSKFGTFAVYYIWFIHFEIVLVVKRYSDYICNLGDHHKYDTSFMKPIFVHTS